jgi:hypothetical protein
MDSSKILSPDHLLVMRSIVYVHFSELFGYDHGSQQDDPMYRAVWCPHATTCQVSSLLPSVSLRECSSEGNW